MTLQDAITAHRTADDAGYDGSSCYAITPRLMRGIALTAPQVELVDTLDSGFNEATGSEIQFEVYRGTHQSSVDLIKKNKDGSFPAFMATSRDVAEALRFLKDYDAGSVLLWITCPVGTKALPISESGLATLEANEILLPRNTRFKVEEWNPLSTISDERHILVQMSPASAYFHLTVLL